MTVLNAHRSLMRLLNRDFWTRFMQKNVRLSSRVKHFRARDGKAEQEGTPRLKKQVCSVEAFREEGPPQLMPHPAITLHFGVTICYSCVGRWQESANSQ